MAVLLRGSPSRRGPAFIAQVCEGCAPDDVIPLLPLLGRKLARKVLDRLFFEAADPYLSVGEAKRCLMAFGQKDRKKLIKKIRNAKAVAKVLDADSDDDSAGLSRGGDDDDDSGEDLRAGGAGGLVDDGGGGGSADDDSQYEGSFIDDGPIEEESYSEPGWSGSDEDA